MPRFLVAIFHPNDYDPSVEDEAMTRDIDDLNDEMVAAGVRVFVGGLHAVDTARSLVREPNGDVVMTEGQFLKADHHVGGFWVLDVASHDEAMEWGRKAVIACRAPVEVRQFHW